VEPVDRLAHFRAVPVVIVHDEILRFRQFGDQGPGAHQPRVAVARKARHHALAGAGAYEIAQRVGRIGPGADRDVSSCASSQRAERVIASSEPSETHSLPSGSGWLRAT
jgi:hypothetical protein